MISVLFLFSCFETGYLRLLSSLLSSCLSLRCAGITDICYHSLAPILFLKKKKDKKKKRKFNLSRFFLLGILSLLSLQSLVLSDFPHNLFGIIGMVYVITVDLLIECQGRQFLLTRGPPASLRSIQLDGKQMLIFVL